MLAYLTRRYGEVGSDQYPARLARAIEYGTSGIPPMSAEDLFAGNRAGEDESEVSAEEIIREYFQPPSLK
jgi:hypothetical protein